MGAVTKSKSGCGATAGTPNRDMMNGTSSVSVNEDAGEDTVHLYSVPLAVREFWMMGHGIPPRRSTYAERTNSDDPK